MEQQEKEGKNTQYKIVELFKLLRIIQQSNNETHIANTLAFISQLTLILLLVRLPQNIQPQTPNFSFSIFQETIIQLQTLLEGGQISPPLLLLLLNILFLFIFGFYWHIISKEVSTRRKTSGMLENYKKQNNLTGSLKLKLIIKIYQLSTILSTIIAITFGLSLTLWADTQLLWLAPLPIINFLSLCAINYLHFLSNQDINLRNLKVFSVMPLGRQQLMSQFHLTECFFLAAISVSNAIFLLLILAISTTRHYLELCKLLKCNQYLNRVSSRFNRAALLMTLTIKVSLIIVLLGVSIFNSNISFIWGLVFTLSYILIGRIITFNIVKKILQEPSSIQQEEAAVLYAFALIQVLTASQNSQEIFILSSSIIHHRLKCKKIGCFCSQNPASNINKQMRDIYVRQCLSELSQKFKNNFLLKWLYLNFLVEYFGEYKKINYEVEKISKSREIWNLSEKFLMECLKMKANYKLVVYNQEHRNLNIQAIIKEQQFEGVVKQLSMEINSRLIQRYVRLGSDYCSLNQLELLLDNNSERIRIMQGYYDEFKEVRSYNLRIYEIFLMYFQHIMPSKPDVSHIRKAIKQKLDSLRCIKTANLDTLTKVSYLSTTSVLESDLHLQRIGIITNCNHQCYSIFGVGKNELKGRNIHNFMRDFMGVPHREMLKAWFQKQNSNIVGKARKSFFVNTLNQVLRINVYLKVRQSIEGLKIYILISKQNDKDYIALNEHFGIEGFGSRIKEINILNQLSMKQHINQYIDLNLEQQMKNKDHIKLTLKLHPQNTQIKNSGITEVDHPSTNRAYPTDTGIDLSAKYLSDVEIEKQYMGASHYYTMLFREIVPYDEDQKKPKKRRKKTVFQLAGMINRMGKKKNQEDRDHSQDFQEENQKILQKQMMETVTSSFHSQGGVNLTKMFVEIQRQAINFDKLRHPSYCNASIFLIFFSLCLLGCILGQFFVYEGGLDTVNNILLSGAAVNDNLQLIQISYNSIVTSQSYCFSPNQQDIARCSELLQSSQYTLGLFYSLYYSDMLNYDVSSSFLSQTQYYEFYRFETPLIRSDGTSEMVDISHFLEYYYYALRQISQLIQSGKQTLPVSEGLQFLYANWAGLKAITSGAVSYYQNEATRQLTIVANYIYYSITFFILLSLGLVLTSLRYYSNFQTKRETVLKMNQHLTQSRCVQLKSLHEKVGNCLQQPTLRNLEDIRDVGSHHDTIRNVNYPFQPSSFHKVCSVFLLLVLSSFNLGSLFSMVSLFAPINNMVLSLKQIMQTENQQLQGYLQMKTYYLYNQLNLSQTQINTQIGQGLNQTEVAFLAVVKNGMNLFWSTDPSFTTDFNQILNQNICEATKDSLEQWQIDKCLNGMHYPFLTHGLGSSMVFYERNTQQAFEYLKEHSSDAKQYFQSQVFSDLDDYQVYLFRQYQATHSRMIKGFANSIISRLGDSLAFISLQVLLLVVLLGVWFWRRHFQNLKMGNLFGQILQYPRSILRQNKVALRTLVKTFQLQH